MAELNRALVLSGSLKKLLLTSYYDVLFDSNLFSTF